MACFAWGKKIAPADGSAEQGVLWKLEGHLESHLKEVFAADYDEQVAKAREVLSGK
ncbi:MAG TPA: hypothetical protein VFC78_21595 [Tepidisphaeraceae bacterium]|nr:hypothetical protein [Tepidisphaeraceae bacterium]